MNVSNQMNEPNSNLDLEEDFSILSNNDEPNRSVYEFWKQFDLKKLQSDLSDQIQELQHTEAKLEQIRPKFVDLFHFNRYKSIENTCVYLYKLIVDIPDPWPILSQRKCSIRDNSSYTCKTIQRLENKINALKLQNESYCQELSAIKIELEQLQSLNSELSRKLGQIGPGEFDPDYQSIDYQDDELSEHSNSQVHESKRARLQSFNYFSNADEEMDQRPTISSINSSANQASEETDLNFNYKYDRVEPPISNAQIAQQVKEMIAANRIGQRFFAKVFLGITQCRLSEILLKPKPWNECTENRKHLYHKMYTWSQRKDWIKSLCLANQHKFPSRHNIPLLVLSNSSGNELAASTSAAMNDERFLNDHIGDNFTVDQEADLKRDEEQVNDEDEDFFNDNSLTINEPLDTAEIGRKVRDLLILNRIGQRFYAKAYLNIQQCRLSEMLLRPKPWAECTQYRKRLYKMMHEWSQSEEKINSLKMTCQLNANSKRLN